MICIPFIYKQLNIPPNRASHLKQMRNMKDKLLNTVCIVPFLICMRFCLDSLRRDAWDPYDWTWPFCIRLTWTLFLIPSIWLHALLAVYKRQLSLSPIMGYYLDCCKETFAYMSLPLSWNVSTFTWDEFVSPSCLPFHQTSLYFSSLLCICTWPRIPFFGERLNGKFFF